jgi:membrane-associated protein
MNEWIDLILHIDHHLLVFAKEHGTLIYLLLFSIVFLETGFIITPFLPGDSLLFAVGTLAAQDLVSLEIIIPLIILAALSGDNVNYTVGRSSGNWIIKQPWFKRDALTKTELFFEKYGPKAVILARFVPIIRTFTPFSAGLGKMLYSRFLSFSIIGSIAWVLIFVLAGFWLGELAFFKQNLKLVFLAIIAVSLLPIAVEWFLHRSKKNLNPQ